MDYDKNYYSEDRRVGDRCFFDERDTYLEFNADLKSFEISPGALNTDYAPQAGLNGFQLYHFECDPMLLDMEFYIGGPSYEAVQTNISQLLKTARQCVIRKEGDIFEYAGVLIDRASENTGVEPYYLLSLRFAVIRRKPRVTKQICGSATIYNEGNEESGVWISVTPESEMESITIMGITLEDLSPGVTYVIDGLAGRVTANGINYFAHTDIIDFPKMQPGKNEIVVSEEIPITVSFYPVFS